MVVVVVGGGGGGVQVQQHRHKKIEALINAHIMLVEASRRINFNHSASSIFANRISDVVQI